MKDWNTKPMRSRRSRVSAVSFSPVRSVPARTTRPPVGRSRPAAHCSSVDLPDPEGPMIAVNDPLGMERVTSSRAVTEFGLVP